MTIAIPDTFTDALTDAIDRRLGDHAIDATVVVGPPPEPGAERETVTEHPTRRPIVPRDTAFRHDDPFLPAPDLRAIGAGLIERWPELADLGTARLDDIETARLGYLWKRKGGKSKGRPVFGSCQKASPLVRHYADLDALILISADHVRQAAMTNYQLEALVYHELKHLRAETDDEDEVRFVVQGHDDELFIDELRRYGAWHDAHRAAAGQWGQLGIEDAR